MNRFAAFILATLAALLLMAATHSPAQAPTQPEAVSVSTQCEEDEPCWDPQTMGNGEGAIDVANGYSRSWLYMGDGFTGVDSGDTSYSWDTTESNRYRERPGVPALSA